MNSEKPSIEIHCADTEESFELTPSDDLWLDMQAFCEVTGLTIPELIQRALDAFVGDTPK